MRNGPVVFIDSGVGGLPYYGAFKKAAPSQPAAYVADRFNFPYGPKSKDELSRIVVDLAHRIVETLDPELLVVACNSASVSALEALRSTFPDLPVVGTVPAVKPAALYSKKRRIGVLATERTVNDPYTAYLSERFAPDCALVGMAAPELVEFVERDFIDSQEDRRRSVAASYIDRFRALDVDAVVLGCTHFLFLAEEFKEQGGRSLAVFDSREGVAKRALALLKAGRNGNGQTQKLVSKDSLFVTGAAAFENKWQKFASFFDLEFRGPLGGER